MAQPLHSAQPSSTGIGYALSNSRQQTSHTYLERSAGSYTTFTPGYVRTGEPHSSLWPSGFSTSTRPPPASSDTTADPAPSGRSVKESKSEPLTVPSVIRSGRQPPTWRSPMPAPPAPLAPAAASVAPPATSVLLRARPHCTASNQASVTPRSGATARPLPDRHLPRRRPQRRRSGTERPRPRRARQPRPRPTQPNPLLDNYRALGQAPRVTAQR